MYKVIIVDDEMLVRKRIRLGFDWNALGYEVLDDVENGYEALSLIEEKKHDLAIVDIAMPELNGIELAKMLRKKNSEIYIVFLTGHSDFIYAQQAINYGCYHYILKPINEEEFIDILKKLADKIEKERNKNSLFSSLSQKQSDADAVLESKFFSELFHSGGNPIEQKDIERKLLECGVDKDSRYCILVYKIGRYLKESATILNRIQETYNAMRAYFAKGERMLIIYDIYDNYIVLLKEVEEYVQENLVEDFAREVSGEIARQHDTAVYCGISQIKKGFGHLLLAYKEAISSLNNTKVLPENTISYKDVEDRENNYYIIPSAMIKELQSEMGNSNYMNCEKLIQELFDEMIEKKTNYECVLLNSNRLLLGISDTAAVSGLEIRQFMNGLSSLEAALDDMVDIQEIIRWFNEIIYNLIESKIRSSSKNKNLTIVERCCKYINQNYADVELSQTKIAEAMFVTPSYISGMFKKIMGMSMMQYISMVRLEKAKELLLEDDKDIRIIAECVGYNDEYYFSRCFKKYHGISPSQIKKIKSKKHIEHF